ncbi:MAG: metal-sulfur cluster assembly factor, partial [bacterium]
KVVIEMTLTSPTCPMAPYIFQNIHESIEYLEGVVAVDIQLIWDPPWSKDKISEAGKMELGLL